MRTHTGALARVCTHGQGCTRSTLLLLDCSFPSQSFSMGDCPRAQPGHGRDPAAGCAQSRGPEEMAPLFTTHPTGIRGHCDKGRKTCGLPMNKHPTRAPPTHPPNTPPPCPPPQLPVAAGQDPWPRALRVSVLEVETLGVGHGLEGQGSPPAGTDLQHRGWEGATWAP